MKVPTRAFDPPMHIYGLDSLSNSFKSVDPLFIGCEITPHHNPYIMVLFFLPTNLLNPSPP
jgi:hypothetical protein